MIQGLWIPEDTDSEDTVFQKIKKEKQLCDLA